MKKSKDVSDEKVTKSETARYLRPRLNYKHYWYLYGLPFLKYFSLRKLGNLLLNLYEYKTKKTYLRSVPWVVYIDPVNACVLNCPLCPTGKKDPRQRKAQLSLKDFKKIIDQLKPYLFFVYLYKWGEPFLNKDIFKMVDYCHQNRVGVLIHSNLNYQSDNILKNVVKSKVDYLSLSIDGATQKNYNFYRRGGNIDKVQSGIKKIIFWKKKLGSGYPKIVWQYLINNQNFREVNKAAKLAKKIGVDVFESRPLFLDMETQLKNDQKDYQMYLSKVCTYEEASYQANPNHCRYLWIGLTVNPQGLLAPCCSIYADSDNFGDLLKHSLKEIINSQIFIESRRLFTDKNYHPKIYTACAQCQWYTKA